MNVATLYEANTGPQVLQAVDVSMTELTCEVEPHSSLSSVPRLA